MIIAYLSLSLLLLSGGLSSSLKTSLLLLLGLRAVLVKELEQLGSSVLVESVGELGDGGRNLQALVKDDLLALEADVLWPLHEAGQISLGANILAYRTPRSTYEEAMSTMHAHQCRSSWG